MSEIKLPNTFEDIYKSIISNDYTYNRVKSIQPNLYFTISLTKQISSLSDNVVQTLINRIKDFSIPLHIFQIYKPLDKIHNITINGKSIYYKPYYIIPNVFNIDSETIILSFLDDINLSLTNEIFNRSNYHFTTQVNKPVILFSNLTITYYEQYNNKEVLTLEFSKLSLNDVEYTTSFSTGSNDMISVSMSLSFTSLSVNGMDIIK